MITWNDVKRTATLAFVAGLVLAIPLACPLTKLILQRVERNNAQARSAAAGATPTPA
jgi:hypothetical protein